MTTPTSNAFEVNFDGIVGNTHNYAGLSFGNIASTSHKAAVANPLEAVLQGLKKMKSLADLGLKQAVLPPQERPDLSTLRRLGFSGSDTLVLERASKLAPELLAACSSASSMWTANAATIAPSADTHDQKVHFTPANLVSKFHRSIEHPTTAAVLRKIFTDPNHFVHHEPLPDGNGFGDEGAANHTRLCNDYGKKGVQFFVFGRYAFQGQKSEPKRFPARQTYEASLAIARLHELDPDAIVFGQQNPAAIDAGVFHNDVAGVGNLGVLFVHEQAYLDQASVLQELQEKFQNVTRSPLSLISVPANAVSLEDAVKSYLFNSQLVKLPRGVALIAPGECKETPSVKAYLDSLLQDSAQPIREVLYYDVKQSMRNGGGPACLRLRVVLSDAEMKSANPKVFMNDLLYGTLTAWAKKHYRDKLSFEDLRDPHLLHETRLALDDLTQILDLGSIYPFQKTT